ncbi:papain family cysteine protease (macronuclear) [Tetrahymena thermophila SB210]|uniref:Papain family cysteine protease n=1 Tax=Tetrahymena thermophila (strain SB210) TaxID=312017 RepID=Q24F16_TETTS|nr:papain family cysteine protease [Tetrahymena thermophila SB210]EAS06391.1 papain family cysteine protease [Tetrahymena thermophila SB210]|eukprot:XP_001026636.1 papain family cysteine protease [Tetrahymena thermophila SB210]
MKQQLKSILYILLFLAFVLGQDKQQSFSDFGKKHLQQQSFLDFKKSFAKKYNSQEHELFRFNVFLENLKEIERLNKEITTAKFDVTQFSDYTKEEFLKLHTGVIIPQEVETSSSSQSNSDQDERKLQSLPLDWDIRVNGPGKLQAVKNQGNCACDTAFSTSATVENLYSIKTGTNVSFSEQQFVDCLYKRDGCQGGWFSEAYNFVINTGIALGSMYPYKQVYGTCKTLEMGNNLYKISGFKNLPDNILQIKQSIVKYGAVAACVDASGWDKYKIGIYSIRTTAKTQCNHAVTIIGYGPDYWLIRNSWGTQWGESGHIRVASNGTGGISTNLVFQPF